MERKPPFVVQYNHKGSTWGFQIWAESWEDAEARLKSIGYNGQIIGSNASTIKTNPVTLPLVALWMPFICWWRNLWQRRP